MNRRQRIKLHFDTFERFCDRHLDVEALVAMVDVEIKKRKQ